MRMRRRGHRASDPIDGDAMLQPRWTKLGLRTTVSLWSPWLFTWIRLAAMRHRPRLQCRAPFAKTASTRACTSRETARRVTRTREHALSCGDHLQSRHASQADRADVHAPMRGGLRAQRLHRGVRGAGQRHLAPGDAVAAVVDLVVGEVVGEVLRCRRAHRIRIRCSPAVPARSPAPARSCARRSLRRWPGGGRWRWAGRVRARRDRRALPHRDG